MEYLHHQIMDASFRKWLKIFSLWSIQDNLVIRCVLLLDWITNYFCYKSSEVEDPIWFLWSSWCCAVKLYFLVESQIMADNQKRSCQRLTTTNSLSPSIIFAATNIDSSSSSFFGLNKIFYLTPQRKSYKRKLFYPFLS